jgi:hypothetical protein
LAKQAEDLRQGIKNTSMSYVTTRHRLFSTHTRNWMHIWEYRKYHGSNKKARKGNFEDSL